MLSNQNNEVKPIAAVFPKEEFLKVLYSHLYNSYSLTIPQFCSALTLSLQMVGYPHIQIDIQKLYADFAQQTQDTLFLSKAAVAEWCAQHLDNYLNSPGDAPGLIANYQFIKEYPYYHGLLNEARIDKLKSVSPAGYFLCHLIKNEQMVLCLYKKEANEDWQVVEIEPTDLVKVSIPAYIKQHLAEATIGIERADYRIRKEEYYYHHLSEENAKHILLKAQQVDPSQKYFLIFSDSNGKNKLAILEDANSFMCTDLITLQPPFYEDKAAVAVARKEGCLNPAFVLERAQQRAPLYYFKAKHKPDRSLDSSKTKYEEYFGRVSETPVGAFCLRRYRNNMSPQALSSEEESAIKKNYVRPFTWFAAAFVHPITGELTSINQQAAQYLELCNGYLIDPSNLLEGSINISMTNAFTCYLSQTEVKTHHQGQARAIVQEYATFDAREHYNHNDEYVSVADSKQEEASSPGGRLEAKSAVELQAKFIEMSQKNNAAKIKHSFSTAFIKVLTARLRAALEIPDVPRTQLALLVLEKYRQEMKPNNMQAFTVNIFSLCQWLIVTNLSLTKKDFEQAGVPVGSVKEIQYKAYGQLPSFVVERLMSLLLSQNNQKKEFSFNQIKQQLIAKFNKSAKKGKEHSYKRKNTERLISQYSQPMEPQGISYEATFSHHYPTVFPHNEVAALVDPSKQRQYLQDTSKTVAITKETVAVNHSQEIPKYYYTFNEVGSNAPLATDVFKAALKSLQALLPREEVMVKNYCTTINFSHFINTLHAERWHWFLDNFIKPRHISAYVLQNKYAFPYDPQTFQLELFNFLAIFDDQAQPILSLLDKSQLIGEMIKNMSKESFRCFGKNMQTYLIANYIESFALIDLGDYIKANPHFDVSLLQSYDLIKLYPVLLNLSDESELLKLLGTLNKNQFNGMKQLCDSEMFLKEFTAWLNQNPQALWLLLEDNIFPSKLFPLVTLALSQYVDPIEKLFILLTKLKPTLWTPQQLAKLRFSPLNSEQYFNLVLKLLAHAEIHQNASYLEISTVFLNLALQQKQGIETVLSRVVASKSWYLLEQVIDNCVKEEFWGTARLQQAKKLWDLWQTLSKQQAVPISSSVLFMKAVLNSCVEEDQLEELSVAEVGIILAVDVEDMISAQQQPLDYVLESIAKKINPSVDSSPMAGQMAVAETKQTISDKKRRFLNPQLQQEFECILRDRQIVENGKLVPFEILDIDRNQATKLLDKDSTKIIVRYGKDDWDFSQKKDIHVLTYSCKENRHDNFLIQSDGNSLSVTLYDKKSTFSSLAELFAFMKETFKQTNYAWYVEPKNLPAKPSASIAIQPPLIDAQLLANIKGAERYAYCLTEAELLKLYLQKKTATPQILLMAYASDAEYQKEFKDPHIPSGYTARTVLSYINHFEAEDLIRKILAVFNPQGQFQYFCFANTPNHRKMQTFNDIKQRISGFDFVSQGLGKMKVKINEVENPQQARSPGYSLYQIAESTADFNILVELKQQPAKPITIQVLENIYQEKILIIPYEKRSAELYSDFLILLQVANPQHPLIAIITQWQEIFKQLATDKAQWHLYPGVVLQLQQLRQLLVALEPALIYQDLINYLTCQQDFFSKLAAIDKEGYWWEEKATSQLLPDIDIRSSIKQRALQIYEIDWLDAWQCQATLRMAKQVLCPVASIEENILLRLQLLPPVDGLSTAVFIPHFADASKDYRPVRSYCHDLQVIERSTIGVFLLKPQTKKVVVEQLPAPALHVESLNKCYVSCDIDDTLTTGYRNKNESEGIFDATQGPQLTSRLRAQPGINRFFEIVSGKIALATMNTCNFQGHNPYINHFLAANQLESSAIPVFYHNHLSDEWRSQDRNESKTKLQLHLLVRKAWQQRDPSAKDKQFIIIDDKEFSAEELQETFKEEYPRVLYINAASSTGEHLLLAENVIALINSGKPVTQENINTVQSAFTLLRDAIKKNNAKALIDYLQIIASITSSNSRLLLSTLAGLFAQESTYPLFVSGKKWFEATKIKELIDQIQAIALTRNSFDNESKLADDAEPLQLQLQTEIAMRQHSQNQVAKLNVELQRLKEEIRQKEANYLAQQQLSINASSENQKLVESLKLQIEALVKKCDETNALVETHQLANNKNVAVLTEKLKIQSQKDQEAQAHSQRLESQVKQSSEQLAVLQSSQFRFVEKIQTHVQTIQALSDQIRSKERQLDFFNTDRGILIAKLTAYLNRIKKYSSSSGSQNQINFSYGFYHHARSRGLNRQANYYLAEFLKDKLLNEPETAIGEIFKNVNATRLTIIKEKNIDRQKDYVNRGINSDELNDIIKLAEKIAKDNPPTRRVSPQQRQEERVAALLKTPLTRNHTPSTGNTG